MRIGIGAIIVSLLFSGAALAQDAGYGYRYQPDGDSGLPHFAGLRGSLAFSSQSRLSVPTAPPTTLHASYDTGVGGSVYVGTRLPLGFRVELEGLYRNLPFNTVSAGGSTAAIRGQAHMAAPMVNLMYDMPVPDFPFRPFIGAGIGGAYVTANPHDSSATYFRPTSWQFAYQFMGGAEIPLSQSSRLTAMYRWMRVNGPSGRCGIAGAPALSCKADLNSQSIDLGIEMDM